MGIYGNEPPQSWSHVDYPSVEIFQLPSSFLPGRGCMISVVILVPFFLSPGEVAWECGVSPLSGSHMVNLSVKISKPPSHVLPGHVCGSYTIYMIFLALFCLSPGEVAWECGVSPLSWSHLVNLSAQISQTQTSRHLATQEAVWAATTITAQAKGVATGKIK